MGLTKEQYEQIKPHLPKQRGNVTINNHKFLNAILYVAENGCKWRGLPSKYGNWHTIYTRMSRWSKAGVLQNIFEQLRTLKFIDSKITVLSLDSTAIKVHPDGTGAHKKTGHKR